MATTTASRFAEFITQLPGEYYFDDSNDDLWEELFDCADGSKTVAKDPARVFDVDRDFGGALAWQGGGTPGPLSGKSVSKVFDQWEKDQVSSVFVCRVPKALTARFRAFAAENGVELSE